MEQGKNPQSLLHSVETAVGIQKCSMKLTQSGICLNYWNSYEDDPFVKIVLLFVMDSVGQDLGFISLTSELIKALIVNKKSCGQASGT